MVYKLQYNLVKFQTANSDRVIILSIKTSLLANLLSTGEIHLHFAC